MKITGDGKNMGRKAMSKLDTMTDEKLDKMEMTIKDQAARIAELERQGGRHENKAESPAQGG